MTYTTETYYRETGTTTYTGTNLRRRSDDISRSPFQEEPSWAADIFRELNQLSSLKPDWDGYGASAIDPDCIQLGEMFLKIIQDSVSTRPHIGPVPDGGVQVEWHYGGVDLIVEFSPEPKASLYFKDGHEEIERQLGWLDAVTETKKRLKDLR